ncbi:MAG: hypothetical protein QXU69_07285 [Thermofilaceae archaeon]
MGGETWIPTFDGKGRHLGIFPWRKIAPGLPVVMESYIIYEEDGRVHARNGRTGEIEFSGADASQVLQKAINAIPGRGIIALASDIGLSSTVTISKTVILDLGRSVVWNAGASPMFRVATTQAVIRDGFIGGTGSSGERGFELLSGSHGILFENVRFDSVYNPILLHGSIWELRVYGCWIDHCHRAIDCADDATDVNLNMRDTWVSNCTDTAIRILKSNAVLIHNCEIMNVEGSPLIVASRYGGDIWVTASEFDYYRYPISIGPNVHDWHFVGCYMAQGANVAGGHALMVYDGCYGGEVIGCHIGALGGHGIYISGSSSLNNRIIGNRIYVPEGCYGILLESSSRNLVAGNQANQPIAETGAADFNLFIANHAAVIKRPDSKSRILASFDPDFDQYKFDSYLIPIGTGNVYGAPVVDLSPSGQFLLPRIIIPIEGTFGSGETVTVKITAYYTDETTSYIEKQYTAPGTYYLDDMDYFNLFSHKKKIWKLEFRAKTNLPSTQVRVYRRLWGV